MQFKEFQGFATNVLVPCIKAHFQRSSEVHASRPIPTLDQTYFVPINFAAASSTPAAGSDDNADTEMLLWALQGPSDVHPSNCLHAQ